MTEYKIFFKPVNSKNTEVYIDIVKAEGFTIDNGILMLYSVYNGKKRNIAAYKEWLRVMENE